MIASPTPAVAQQAALDLGLVYRLDLVQAEHRAYALDRLDLTSALDLDRALGWRGASMYAHVTRDAGDKPSDDFATLQGVDDIEVSRAGVRLIEFWFEQTWDGGASSVGGGLHKLDNEFYVTDAAGLFVNPAFGGGTELGVTAAHAPSTALTLRYRRQLGENTALQVAVLNADAGTWGDQGGVDLSFDHGVLFIGEGQMSIGRADIALGGWRYSERQADLRGVDAHGEPVRHAAQGLYAMLEAPLWGEADTVRRATSFVRVGLSDGQTGAFSGGWQGGIVIEHVFASRSNSAIGLGLTQARLSDGFRLNAEEAGVRLAPSETTLELTYVDRLTPNVSLQGSLQWAFGPEADETRADAGAAILRLKFEL